MLAWISHRTLMGFTRQARPRASWDGGDVTLREEALIETITCKLRLLAPWQKWIPPWEEEWMVLGTGEGWGREGREIGNLSGMEEKQNNSTEWGTGLPGRWQKDISPLWQGQKPLSMSCTLQGQERQMRGGGGHWAPRSLFSTNENPLKTLPCFSAVGLLWICSLSKHRLYSVTMTHCCCFSSQFKWKILENLLFFVPF